MVHLPVPAWIVLIAAIITVPAGFMFLVTTFLFAFSGSQVRMVPVVAYGALTAILASAIATAIVAWSLRSGAATAIAAAIATGVSWTLAVVVEWVLSFALAG